MAAASSAVTPFAAIFTALASFVGRPRGAPSRYLPVCPVLVKGDQASSQIANGRKKARIVRQIWQGSNRYSPLRRSRVYPICILDSALPNRNHRSGPCDNQRCQWFLRNHCTPLLPLLYSCTIPSAEHCLFSKQRLRRHAYAFFNAVSHCSTLRLVKNPSVILQYVYIYWLSSVTYIGIHPKITFFNVFRAHN